jgi:serine/threonine protein kinase
VSFSFLFSLDSLLTIYFYRQGGFARVYAARSRKDGQTYAFKVIHKPTIESSKRNKSKLLAELKIHKSMKHTHIVRFIDQFEDRENVYFRLELCSNGVSAVIFLFLAFQVSEC